MKKRTAKYRGRIIPPGVEIIRNRFVVRLGRDSEQFFKTIGALSLANLENAIILRNQKLSEWDREDAGRAGKTARLPFDLAIGLFWALHAIGLKSAYSYKSTFLPNIKRFFADRCGYFDELRPSHIKEYRVWREAQGVSPASVNKEHGVIVAMYNVFSAMKEEGKEELKNAMLPPIYPGRRVRKAKEAGRTRIFGEGEHERLMASANNSLRRYIIAKLETQLRRKDLLQFRLSKNVTADGVRGIQSKTGKPYYVPVDRQSHFWRVVETSIGDRLFTMSESSLERYWREAVKRAGLKDLQERDLRREKATRLLLEGADIRSVSSMLGHSSIRMTESYTVPTMEGMRKASVIGLGLYRLDDKDCNDNCNRLVTEATGRLVKTI